ncbi:MAG: anti-sigma factor [Propionibacteriales bacterium]|nr:anti-sigma factor [Propionibacteriales bacterium]
MSRHQVALTVPADSSYVALLRATTAGVAARLDFTLDDIDDLRLAVDEACGLLLRQARPESTLFCGFRMAEPHLSIDVTAQADSPRLPPRDGFAWTVLTSLAGDVHASVDEDSVTLTLSRKREGATP